MKNYFLSLGLGLFWPLMGVAQDNYFEGSIKDALSNQPIVGAEVMLQQTGELRRSDENGSFIFTAKNLPGGTQFLLVNKENYLPQRVPIQIENGTVENTILILLKLDLFQIESQVGSISLSDLELEDDYGETATISGQLSASKDAFQKATSYDFSATFFRSRGAPSENAKVLINGIEMNEFRTGRAQWNHWGGLNDVLRNQEFTLGFEPNPYCFGDVGGTTNLILRASRYRKGGQVSFAKANRSYTHRTMGSYHSGRSLNGWAYSAMASHRYAKEGNIQGTNYRAYSLFIAIEKELNRGHSIGLMSFYSPSVRGRSSALTDEVYSLKGTTYNPNWGLQEGRQRNSRERSVSAPFLMLSHFWEFNQKSTLNTNVGYQMVLTGNKRLDYGTNRSPFKNYYQRLPSYFLRMDSPSGYDYQLAYLGELELKNNGQLDWNSLYELNSNESSGYSSHALQEDRIVDNRFSLNSQLTIEINAEFTINATIEYKLLKGKNYAVINDLLGGGGWMDTDLFYNGKELNFNQSDVNHPNRIVGIGDIYKYHYQLAAGDLSTFIQGQWRSNHFDWYLAGTFSALHYQREGIFRNGYFQSGARSYGKSERLSFTTFGLKGGGLYKINGKHLLRIHTGFFTKPPSINNSFANVRQNNDLVDGLTSERIMSGEIGYQYRTPTIQAKLTTYVIDLKNQTSINQFFTQNALGADENNAFVQEIVQGIGKRNLGIEWGCEVQLIPSLKLKTAFAYGQNRYTNNPSLYLSGDDFDYHLSDGYVEGNDLAERGKRRVYLADYHVSGGPEHAYQVGFEYRDSDFWWVGVTTNYFSNGYISISKLRRSDDFALDTDNLVYANYDHTTAKDLLHQEQFDDYLLVNFVGGKSWRVNGYYLGFFAAINNLLNTQYKTGGFEDSRKASYPQLLEELSRSGGPLFGNRYYNGSGTTYYLNFYVRF